MKHAFPTLLLIFSMLTQIEIQAQSIPTPGIAGGQSFGLADVSNEFFRRKEKRYDRARNDRLRDQNERLERQIYQLEQDLDACMQDRNRRRYPRRRNTSRYDLRNDYFGERRIEREYQELKEENEFLRDQHDWLENELYECEDRYQRTRSRSRDRYDRGRDDRRYRQHDTCCNHSHHGRHHPSHSKGKHKGKHKNKHYRCDDD